MFSYYSINSFVADPSKSFDLSFSCTVFSEIMDESTSLLLLLALYVKIYVL